MSPAKRKSAASTKASAAKSAKAKASTKASAKASAKATKDATFVDHHVEVARELAAIAEARGVSEMIYETDGLTLTLRRGDAGVGSVATFAPPSAVVSQAPAYAPVAVAPAAVPAASVPAAPAAAEVDNAHVVTSPFVGTFYRAPNPDSPNYVEPGQSVSKGQVLCIVEAMKLMNEIEADISGTITTILVKNAESVEYGQALFKIEPA